MKSNRKSNTQCCKCGVGLYRRPWELEKGYSAFCFECYKGSKITLEPKRCKVCDKEYKPKRITANYCSRECSNTGRAGIKYSKDSYGSRSRKRLELLKDRFAFDCCMVDGCNYNKTYDIHRLVEGKNGGEYVIGNMFAICPNHHAEVTRKIIELEKISDCKLRVVVRAAY